MEDSIRAIEAGLKKEKVKSRSQALLVLGQAHFELENFEEAKKQFRAAARDEDKRIKKTANSWIKYAENEEIRVKNLALAKGLYSAIRQAKSQELLNSYQGFNSKVIFIFMITIVMIQLK